MFNLYPFTYTDSTQKVIGTDGSHTVNEGYVIPTLLLENVEVRNLLADYQSLVYIEIDNLIV